MKQPLSANKTRVFADKPWMQKKSVFSNKFVTITLYVLNKVSSIMKHVWYMLKKRNICNPQTFCESCCESYLRDSLSKSSPIQVKGWTATRVDTSTSWTSWVEARTISLELAWNETEARGRGWTRIICYKCSELQSSSLPRRSPYW